jgi:S-DNA-T family DNA segregation ATPase FtsK/SpoIIIE
MQRMIKKKRNKNREIFGIIILAVSIMLIFGVITGSKFLGEFGEYIQKYFIRSTFGYPVVFIPLITFCFGWCVFFSKPISSLFKFSSYSLIFMLLISYCLTLINLLVDGKLGDIFNLGGAVGLFLGSKSLEFLGNFGSVIVLISAFLIFIFSLFDIDVSRKYNFLEEKIKGVFLYIKRIIENEYKKRRKVFDLIKNEKKDVIREEIVSPKEEIEEINREEIDVEEELEPQITFIEIEKEKKILPPKKEKMELGEYVFPPIDLLDYPPDVLKNISQEELIKNAEIIETTLSDFGVEARVKNVTPGPVITMYEVSPAPGVKISKIASLSDDLALAMKAKGIRIIAPIPGKDVIGIEIPNKNPSTVYLRELISSEKLRETKSKLAIAFGKTIDGEIYVTDLAKMPHLLIAGSTGSGKSVGINTIIANILYRVLPDEVQFALIDPKKLELSVYKKLENHHLLTVEGIDENVITKPNNAVILLKALEREMERRYGLLARMAVRNIEDYNRKISEKKFNELSESEKLCYIVVVIDELADLMITSGKEIEESVARLAQMSRAIGIHMIIATQRPSVDVLTGVIKANFSARIAYQVATKVDSRTILDVNGAEQLLGKGDMLFSPMGEPKPIRIQNAFVSSEEIDRIVNYITQQPIFHKEKLSLKTVDSDFEGNGINNGEKDPLFNEAKKLVIIHQQGSISLLQRRLKIGYSRAARLIDQLEQEGIVGPFDGSKARKVLYDEDSLNSFDN